MDRNMKQNKVTTYGNKSFVYMEYLRAISIFAVIMIHVSGANWYRLEIGSFNWTVQTFYNVITRFSVCIFCMISGALMLRPGKELSIRLLLGKYAKRVLICYAVWTVIYALYYTAVNGGDPAYFCLHLFQIPKHLWYLLMLTGLYIATPVLKWISQNRKVTLYLIWICVIFGVVFGTISGVSGFFSKIGGDHYGYSLWKEFLDDLENMNMTFVPGYLGLYLAGHYIHEYGLGKWHKTVVRLALPALIMSAVLTVLISVITQRYVYTFMLETNPLVILGTAGIFGFFKGAGEDGRKYDPASDSAKRVLLIGADSFGIYLTHLMVLDILDHYLHFNVASYPAIISVPVNSLLIFIISLLITVILKKIPVISKTVT